jgi:hypothetical protein
MEDLRAYLEAEFAKIHSRMDHEFEKVHKRMDHEFGRLWKELEDVKRVVRDSAQDILENQVEEVAHHNLHEAKIQLLEAKTHRIDQSVLDLKRRVESLEKANQ